MVEERALNRVQGANGQARDRRHLRAIELEGARRASGRRHAVAGTVQAPQTASSQADLAAGHAQFLAQHIGQDPARLDPQPVQTPLTLTWMSIDRRSGLNVDRIAVFQSVAPRECD
jgi:hypothetical protein